MEYNININYNLKSYHIQKLHSIEEIAEQIKDNMKIMIGGFGLCGTPEMLIYAIKFSGAKNLTIISNNFGTQDKGIGILLETHQVTKLIASYIGENKLLEKLMIENKLEVELTPQGTLAEKIRCAGSGIPAFFTRTGIGTIIEKGKEKRIFNNKEYLLEEALYADLALVKAHKSDLFGNITYNKTARNFNPVMAKAANKTIFEVEEILHEELDPNFIHTPSIFVNSLIVANYKKHIEK
ncbi:MAG: CoA transferase subunit A [Rickettsiales bacterium]